jgi:hypothetical protein
MSPFTIAASETLIHADAALLRAQFEERSSLLFSEAFEPGLLDKLMTRAAAAPFVEDIVKRIGTREIEQPQRVGASISLLLGRLDLLEWLERATGLTPLRAVAGRLAQTRTNGCHELVWHDDMSDDRRRLGVVVNLSDQPFTGGEFEMRRKGSPLPFHMVKHDRPGAMMVFAVDPRIEHRVTPVVSGGPRRVYAGWAMTEPEHPGGLVARSLAG